MEETNQPTIVKPKSSWKVVAITLIATNILLVGTTAYFIISNINSSGSNIGYGIEQPDKECPEEIVIAPEIDDANYLVVREWGIRLKIPEGFLRLSYMVEDSWLILTGTKKMLIYEINDTVDYNFESDFFVKRYNKEVTDFEETGMGTRPILIAEIDGYNYYLSYHKDSGQSGLTKSQLALIRGLLTRVVMSIERA